MSTEASLATAADESELLRRLRTFVGWVGGGRKLTQTGRITLADARELVALLGTGDEIDPSIGERVFRTTSSEELPELTMVVEWAKAARLVRVNHGRLVPVKKHTSLLDHPPQLWVRMFEVFGQLGQTVCPSGWAETLLRCHFDEGADAMLTVLHRCGAAPVAELYALAWETVTGRYILDPEDEQQLATWRRLNDGDASRMLDALERLGAIELRDGVAELTELGRWGMRRSVGEPEPGDRVYQVKITLLGVSRPPVWRRLLVPSRIRLDQLHGVIQAAMGWENDHMHAFSDGSAEYGLADPELEHRDERKATLQDLAKRKRSRALYTYDFGDNWEHDIVVEAVLTAEPEVRYPVCVAGSGACPPEDCGGISGYELLREALADPTDDEHEQMMEWLGLEDPADFDPTAFDVDKVNHALTGGSAPSR
jgi:hypothetical protein